jgi:hypothetical protein
VINPAIRRISPVENANPRTSSALFTRLCCASAPVLRVAEKRYHEPVVGYFRGMVEQFTDPESKRLMLWIADEYEILAERADADLDKLSPKNSN